MLLKALGRLQSIWNVRLPPLNTSCHTMGLHNRCGVLSTSEWATAMDEEVQPEGMTDSLGICYRDKQSSQCHCQCPATRHTFRQEPSFRTSQDVPRGAPPAPFCVLEEGQQHEIPIECIHPAMTAEFTDWGKETVLILLGCLTANRCGCTETLMTGEGPY